MQNHVKRALFVVFGLAVITAGIFLGKSTEAAVKEGQKFDDWVVNCAKDEKGKKVCLLVQPLTTAKDAKTEVIAAYQIGYFGKDKELKIIQILPLGLSIEAGTSIISSGKLIVPGKFTTCTNIGCNALASISAQDLATILDSKENFVGYMNNEGKQVNLPFSTKGLEEGLKALK